MTSSSEASQAHRRLSDVTHTVKGIKHSAEHAQGFDAVSDIAIMSSEFTEPLLALIRGFDEGSILRDRGKEKELHDTDLSALSMIVRGYAGEKMRLWELPFVLVGPSDVVEGLAKPGRISGSYQKGFLAQSFVNLDMHGSKARVVKSQYTFHSQGSLHGHRSEDAHGVEYPSSVFEYAINLGIQQGPTLLQGWRGDMATASIGMVDCHYETALQRVWDVNVYAPTLVQQVGSYFKR